MFFQPKTHLAAVFMFLLSILSIIPSLLYWYVIYWTPKMNGKLSSDFFACDNISVIEDSATMKSNSNITLDHDISHMTNPLMGRSQMDKSGLSHITTHDKPWYAMNKTNNEDLNINLHEPDKNMEDISELKNSFQENMASNFGKSEVAYETSPRRWYRKQKNVNQQRSFVNPNNDSSVSYLKEFDE